MSLITIIRPRKKWELLDIAELWKYRELLQTFTWRDLKVRYKHTVLGIAWVLLQPLLTMVIFTLFFGNYASIPSGDLPYSVFVLVGIIFWNNFSNSISRASTVFIENEQLVRKVFFPREILPLSTIGTAFIDFLFSVIIFICLLAFYGIVPGPVFILLFLFSILITVIASTGMGLLLASINVTYRDVRYALPFFLQLMIFITPVIYPLGLVRPSFQYLLALNPMAGIITALRVALETNTIENYPILLVSLTSALVLLVLGFSYFRYTEKFIADLL